ncbi:MAG: M13-type metalloendopeptidase [Pyrinomonadaceae bacterium]
MFCAHTCAQPRKKRCSEAARLRTATDPHPLARFRINGLLSNMPTFAPAFQ